MLHLLFIMTTLLNQVNAFILLLQLFFIMMTLLNQVGTNIVKFSILFNWDIQFEYEKTEEELTMVKMVK